MEEHRQARCPLQPSEGERTQSSSSDCISVKRVQPRRLCKHGGGRVEESLSADPCRTFRCSFVDGMKDDSEFLPNGSRVLTFIDNFGDELANLVGVKFEVNLSLSPPPPNPEHEQPCSNKQLSLQTPHNWPFHINGGNCTAPQLRKLALLFL